MSPVLLLCRSPRRVAVAILGVLAAVVLLAPGELGIHARLAFVVFGAAVYGWVATSLNDTYVALAAAMSFVLVGIGEPETFFESFGEPTIWLLLGSFVIAAAAQASGLSNRLAVAVATRAGSVRGLFYALTGALIGTAFVIPSTSGRAALMVPIFVALASAIEDRRIVRALALLIPSVILLSAIASLIGAGAHLVTAEILAKAGHERLDFGRWLALGAPFAFVSCFLTCWVIQRMFLNAEERARPLALRADQLDGGQRDLTAATGPLSRAERTVLYIVGALVLAWCTAPLHGLDNTLVALVGALAVTAPQAGVVSFKDALKAVDWNILLFLAATLELGESLIESGAAAWLVDRLLGTLDGPIASSPLVVVAFVALVSLLSHLVINSRTARASVLVPLIVLLGLSLGFNPTMLAFLSTAAAGFCLTLPVSAKPVMMFGALDQPTYEPRDLLRLSRVLIPAHFVLLVAFAFSVWPALGLSLKGPGDSRVGLPRQVSQTVPQPVAYPTIHSSAPADDQGEP